MEIGSARIASNRSKLNAARIHSSGLQLTNWRCVMSIRLIAAIALLALTLPAVAQDPRYDRHDDRGPGGDAVDCRSNNYSFEHCRVPWRNAKLVRQLSDTECVRGVNWGLDREGIWVDRGCAGRFVAAGGRRHYDERREEAGGWMPPSGWDQRFQVRCDSNDYQYNFCAVDLGGGGRARIERQISGSPCVEGQNWGWNRAGIWVTQGCAAVFLVDRRWR